MTSLSFASVAVVLLNIKMLYTNNMARSKPWTVLSQSLFATAGMAFVFSAQAQPVASPPPPGPMQPAVHQLPSYCRGSTLTGVEFLQLIQTIMAHGDLTDITFLEKTLGTKFSSHYGTSEGGTPDPKILLLNSNHVLGNPIAVDLYIYYQKSEDLKSVPIASLGFDAPSKFITDCFHFSPADISSGLGQEFFGEVFGPGSATRLYSPENSRPAKNGSKIQIDFSYDLEENSVDGIIIRQFH